MIARPIIAAMLLGLCAQLILSNADSAAAGPLLLLYPPIIGGLGFLAARDATKTWRSLRREPLPAGVTAASAGVFKFVALVALGIDSILIVSAAFILYVLIAGTGIR